MDGDTPLLIHVQVYLARSNTSNRIFIAHLFLLREPMIYKNMNPSNFVAVKHWNPQKRKLRESQLSRFCSKKSYEKSILPCFHCCHPQWYPVAQEAVDAALRTLNLPIREVVHLACWRSIGWCRMVKEHVTKGLWKAGEPMRIKQEWDIRVVVYIIWRQHHSFYGSYWMLQKRMFTSHPCFVFVCSW